MNADLTKASNSDFSGSNWFLAEYGLTQDPLSEANDQKSVPGASKGVKSIVIKNQNFVQLERPFPYSGRVFNAGANDFNKAVRSIDNSLKEFEIQAQMKRQKRALKKKRKSLND
jgi:hypothetical protein